MSGLLYASDVFALHDPGPRHPERAARYRAVLAGLGREGLAGSALLPVLEAPPAPLPPLAAVHDPEYLARIQATAGEPYTRLDPDTVTNAVSYEAALRAAGAGLDATTRLRAGEAEFAFCAVRPPGHHATRDRAMGFCLFNSAAVAARALADRGERVLIFDWDAHHGNGTQAIFDTDPGVLYASTHEWPQYPGTGRSAELGTGAGAGYTVNFPFPSGTGLPAFERAIDEVVAPLAVAFRPDWLLVSAGYDAHRDDLLCSLALTASGYAALTRKLLPLVPNGRTMFFLEGGYDLDALANSAFATVSAALGLEPNLPERELEVHDAPEAAHRAIDATKAALRPYWEGVL